MFYHGYNSYYQVYYGFYCSNLGRNNRKNMQLSVFHKSRIFSRFPQIQNILQLSTNLEYSHVFHKSRIFSSFSQIQNILFFSTNLEYSSAFHKSRMFSMFSTNLENSPTFLKSRIFSSVGEGNFWLSVKWFKCL